MRIKGFLFLFFLLGCSPQESNSGEALATLGNKKLYLDDVVDQMPQIGEFEPGDSAALVHRIIRTWAKNELLVEAAEFNLKTELKQFEDLIVQYRNDLLKHAYIDRYVRENLDTSIGKDEIQDYYESNKENFELKESIIKAKFTAAPVEAQKVSEAKAWFTREKESDEFLEWIEVFATKQSAYSDSSWIPLDEFLSEIPLESSNPYSYLTRNVNFTCQDTLMVYFVEVNDLRIAESYSPVEYVEGRIEKMILNKRRLELIEQIESNIISNAIEKGDLRIH